jgi:hypothetical protein
MAQPWQRDVENGLHHVTSRRWERCVLVRNHAACQHWLELLDRVAVRCGWRVFAWMLMTNRFQTPFVAARSASSISTRAT